MAKIYGALEVAQLEWFTDAGKPAASSYIYRVIYVSDLKQVMVSDGSNWIPFLNTSTNQTVTGNITFAGQQIFNGLHRLSVTTDSSSTGAVTALNNVTPVIEFTAAVTSVSGIVNSASGATVMLVNRTGSTFSVLDEDAGATAANRIRTGTGAPIALANNASIVLTYVGDNRWHIVGGSGSGSGSAGINYITNGTAEADTVGWAVYAESDAVTFQDTGDTVTLNSHGLSNGNQISFTSIVSTTGISTNTLYFVISATTNTFQVATTATGSALPLTTNGSGTMVRFAPKVGTGGSANVTITRTTTTPLVGTASFLLAKDAANRQGQGWSYDFTIDLANRAKVLQISFDYLVSSGTFVAGATGSNSDVTVWIYDITNAVLIQPSNIKLFSNNASISDKFQASFQTASNSSSYRLIIHVTSTSASAYTLEVDSVSVSPSDYVFGTPVTDWQSYTPTLTGFGTPTSVEFQWRRVGSDVEIRGKFVSGTSTAVEARATLPSGLTSADTTRIPSISIVGYGALNVVTATNYAVLIEPSVTYMTFGAQSASAAGLSKLNATTFLSSGQGVSFFARIPIQGWSSSVQTSDSADTRVVAALIRANTANQSITASTAISWGGGSVFDTHGAYNGTTSYTIPVSGFYEIKIGDFNTAASCYAYLYKNGSYETTLIYCDSGVRVEWGSKIVSLRAGDVLTIVPNATTTLQYSAGNYRADWSITRISGPSAIAATETVACRYYNTAGTSVGASLVTIPFATKTYDTHGAWNTSTSEFTAPISGKYFALVILQSTTTNTLLSAGIHKNGVAVAFMFGQIGSNSTNATVSTVIDLLAGDKISFKSNSGTTTTLSTTVDANHICIVRMGN